MTRFPEPAMNALAIAHGDDRYIFLYADGRETDVMRQAGKYAANAELNFTWRDAANLS